MNVWEILGPLFGGLFGAGMAAYYTGQAAEQARTRLLDASYEAYADDTWNDDDVSESSQALIDAAENDPTAVGYWTPATAVYAAASLTLGGAGIVLKWPKSAVTSLLASGAAAVAGGGVYGWQVDTAHGEAVRTLAEDFPGLGEEVAAQARMGTRAWMRGRMAAA